MAKLNVLMAAGEALPFSKTGGLADVLGALPPQLARLGARVLVAVPYHRQSAGGGGLETAKVISSLDIPLGKIKKRVSVYRSRVDDTYDAYLIRHDPSFARPYLYGPPGGDYPDNAQRFALFSRAVVQLLDRLDEPVDLVHGHDWQTALIPLFLAGKKPSVFTIHNLGYQGIFPPEVLDDIGVGREHFHPEGIEFFDKVNFLKAGIIHGTALTTVSPQYGREIRQPSHGFGLDGLLCKYAFKLHGILNGADYSRWDPATDPEIAAAYFPEDLSGKAACKRDLLEAVGLPGGFTGPVVGMTTRLARQKGIDLLLEALPEIMALNLCLVILGEGDSSFQRDLEQAAARQPRLRLVIGFNERLAHRIIAGADIFLMPSRYEPCGLSQLYGLKYGTVPVVRATGGLKDTVESWRPGTGEGVGFTFEEEEPAALFQAIRRAIDTFGRPEEWRRIMLQGMSKDYSWARSAANYLELYRQVITQPALAGGEVGS